MYLFPNQVTLLPRDLLSLPWAALTLSFDSSGHWAELALLCFYSVWIMGQILIFLGQYWERKGQKWKTFLAAQAHPWPQLFFLTLGTISPPHSDPATFFAPSGAHSCDVRFGASPNSFLLLWYSRVWCRGGSSDPY